MKRNFINKVVRILGIAERKTTQDKMLHDSLKGIMEHFDKTGTLPVNVRIERIPTKGALNAMVVVRGITPIHYRHEINGNPEWVPVYEDCYVQVFNMRKSGPANWNWHYTRLREEPLT